MIPDPPQVNGSQQFDGRKVEDIQTKLDQLKKQLGTPWKF